MCVCMCVCVYVCMCVCMCVCMHVCMYVYLGNFSETLLEVFLSQGIATSMRVHFLTRLFLMTMSGRFAEISLSVRIGMSLRVWWYHSSLPSFLACTCTTCLLCARCTIYRSSRVHRLPQWAATLLCWCIYVFRYLIFVADAALWICVIFNDVTMVRFCEEGLVLCSCDESFFIGLETKGLWFVAFISTSASLIRAGCSPCNVFSSHRVCIHLLLQALVFCTYSFRIFSFIAACWMPPVSFVHPQIFLSSFLLQFFDDGRVVDMNIGSARKSPPWANSILMSPLNVFTMVRRSCCYYYNDYYYDYHDYDRWMQLTLKIVFLKSKWIVSIEMKCFKSE